MKHFMVGGFIGVIGSGLVKHYDWTWANAVPLMALLIVIYAVLEADDL